VPAEAFYRDLVSALGMHALCGGTAVGAAAVTKRIAEAHGIDTSGVRMPRMSRAERKAVAWRDVPQGWHLDLFAASVASFSDVTVDNYVRDVANFADWSASSCVCSPAGVDRLLLRRYLGHLAESQIAKPYVARTTSSLRRYFRWATRTGLCSANPMNPLTAPQSDPPIGSAPRR
jgi:hypothetical protein